MKLRLVTLAALAALSGQVMAANSTPVTPAEALAATDVAYISGSSAAKGILAGLVSQNCVSGSFTTFAGPKLTVNTNATLTISSSVGNAYACHVAATNDWGLAEDTVVVVNKRDLLGSGYGVFPVAQNLVVEFTDLSTCTGSGTAYTCTGTSSRVPDAGISDAEATLFNGTYNKPYAFSANAAVASTDFSSSTTLFSQVFGVAVTTKLAAEMITAGNYVLDASGNKVPSLSSVQVANLLSTNVTAHKWKGIATSANSTVGVNICTRDIGSGTRAAANTVFLQNGLTGLTPFSASIPTSGQYMAAAADTAKVYVNQAGSGGDVVTCLGTVNALAKGFGIGLLTLGQGTNANYQFAAIDGVLPSRDNAKVGKYNFWVESSIQTNANATSSDFSSGTMSAGARAFLKAFITKAALAENLASVGSPALAGVFALPTSTYSSDATADCSSYAGTFPAVGDTTSAWTSSAPAADAFCSRYTRNAVSTKQPKFIK